jgi:hypothetical protein
MMTIPATTFFTQVLAVRRMDRCAPIMKRTTSSRPQGLPSVDGQASPSVSPGGDETAKEVGSPGCVSNSCKDPSLSDDDDADKEDGPLGGVGDSCKSASPSDGDEEYKGGGLLGKSGKESELVDPSGGGEEGEAVAPFDLDWCRSFDMTATLLTDVGTTRSSCA